MAVGDPGSESFQHLPDHPRRRLYLGAKSDEYSGKKIYDPTKPATNHFQEWWDSTSNFSSDMSRSKMDLFLKSPRDFWMRYNTGFVDQIDSPTWTINDRTVNIRGEFECYRLLTRSLQS